MATIADVARIAGVSKATVSRALNDPQLVSAEKLRLVTAAVRELDYRPSMVASGLKSRRFHALAVAVADSGNPFFAALTKELAAEVERHGYRVSLFDLDHREDRVISFLRSLPQQGVDAAVLATGDRLHSRGVQQTLKDVKASGFPLVLNGQRLDRAGIPSVVADHDRAAEDAVAHLADMGATPMAFVGQAATSVIAAERAAGFVRAVQGMGHEPIVIDGELSYQAGHNAGHLLLDRHPDIQGIVTANDQVGIGLLRAMHERGVHIPDDIAITSFDDLPVARFVTPSLTTMRGDLATSATVLVSLLLRQLAQEEVPPITTLGHQLIVRESSARKSRGG